MTYFTRHKENSNRFRMVFHWHTKGLVPCMSLHISIMYLLSGKYGLMQVLGKCNLNQVMQWCGESMILRS